MYITLEWKGEFILKKVIIASLMFLMMGAPALHAQGCYSSSTGGCGYVECRRAPCITPAVALGTIALVAIIAVAVQNSQGRGAHSHGHCSCSG